jgi:spore maturation protein CgeB
VTGDPEATQRLLPLLHPDRSAEIWGAERGSYLKGYLSAFEAFGYPIRQIDRERIEHWEEISPRPPACVIDINFHPKLQRILTDAGIPYVSINWDVWPCSRRTPPMEKDYRHSPLSYVFTCDPPQVPALQERVGHAEHLPLGCDLEHFRPEAAPPDERYAAAVSFVGSSLVEDQSTFNGYYHFQQQLNRKRLNAGPEESRLIHLTRQLIDEAIELQRLDLFHYRLPQIVEELERKYPVHLVAPEPTPEKETALILLSFHIAMLRRIDAVKALAPLGVSVWGPPDWKTITTPGVRYRGMADRTTEVSIIARASAINLNVTKCHGDESSGPRPLEVLGSGGFLLSNANAGLLSLFEDGKDLVTYTSLEDLKEKARYYLDHPDERTRIAEQGCRTVHARHGIRQRVQHIIGILIRDHVLARTTARES